MELPSEIATQPFGGRGDNIGEHLERAEKAGDHLIAERRKLQRFKRQLEDHVRQDGNSKVLTKRNREDIESAMERVTTRLMNAVNRTEEHLNHYRHENAEVTRRISTLRLHTHKTSLITGSMVRELPSIRISITKTQRRREQLEKAAELNRTRTRAIKSLDVQEERGFHVYLEELKAFAMDGAITVGPSLDESPGASVKEKPTFFSRSSSVHFQEGLHPSMAIHTIIAFSITMAILSSMSVSDPQRFRKASACLCDA